LNTLFTKPMGGGRTQTAQLFIQSALQHLEDGYRRAVAAFTTAQQTHKDNARGVPDQDPARSTVEMDRCVAVCRPASPCVRLTCGCVVCVCAATDV
jgi:hypothetical protein